MKNTTADSKITGEKVWGQVKEVPVEIDHLAAFLIDKKLILLI